MNPIEFLAHSRNNHQKCFTILSNLRRAEIDWKRTLSGNHKKIMEYWQKKADDFIAGIHDDSETYISTNFVSLMDKNHPIWIIKDYE